MRHERFSVPLVACLLVSGCALLKSKSGPGSYVYAPMPQPPDAPIRDLYLLTEGGVGLSIFENDSILAYAKFHMPQWVDHYNVLVERRELPQSYSDPQLGVSYRGHDGMKFMTEHKGTGPSWYGQSYDALVAWLDAHPEYAKGGPREHDKTLMDWPPTLPDGMGQ